MTYTETKIHLTDSLHTIATLLSGTTADDWQRPQNGKWTMSQEFEHLRTATQGTAFLLSPMNRPAWRPADRASRSYETIVQEYRDGLAARPIVVGGALAPTAESDALTVAEQAGRWQQATQQLLTVVEHFPEADLDAYTIWKHPILGPITPREMLYFTTYHTQHHEASLARKRG